MSKPGTIIWGVSSQGGIEIHHAGEADEQAEGSQVLEAAPVGLRDDLIADDEQHRAGRKGQCPGH